MHGGGGGVGGWCAIQARASGMCECAALGSACQSAQRLRKSNNKSGKKYGGGGGDYNASP